MKHIYLLTIILITFTSGILIAKNQYQATDENFLKYQQYDPQYITFNHEEMLYECEKHNLEYYYEDGTCINPNSNIGLD